MMRRLAPVVIAAVVLSGCGSPQTATYVDPNDDAAYAGSDAAGGRQPFVKYGADAAQRAKSVVMLRSALAASRTLHATDPAGATAVLDIAMTDQLPYIEPRLERANPQLRSRMRSALEALRDRPPADDEAYAKLMQRTAGMLFDQVTTNVVPAPARNDAGFRAAIFAETVLEASLAYEEAAAKGVDPSDRLHSYRIAYGLLLEARTRSATAIPIDVRDRVLTKLSQVANRDLPGPTPPEHPRSSERVTGALTAASDLVTNAAGIDTTYPTPDAATPDQLRSLKRAVAGVVETAKRNRPGDALTQLQTADASMLIPASGGLAAVDGDLLAQIERGIDIDLPAAIRTGGDPAATGAQIDALLDQAITLVESELAQLREDGSAGNTSS